MAISFVQANSNGAGTFSISLLSVAYSSDVTKGNLLVAWMAMDTNLGVSPVISDTLANSWTFDTSENNGDNLITGQWHCVTNASGATTVSMTVSDGGVLTTAIGIVAEYSGVAILDQAASQINKFATTLSSGSVSTLEKPELAIGLGVYYTSSELDSMTPGEGWTSRLTPSYTSVDTSNAFIAGMLEDQILETTGSVEATMGSAAVNDQIASIVSFYAGASGNAGSLMLLNVGQ